MAKNSGLGYYDKEFCQVVTGAEFLKENIRRVLMTRPGERVNNLTYGSRIQEYIFSNASLVVEDLLVEIKSSIERCEPRVSVKKVVIDNMNSEGKINISIYATEKETKQAIDVGVVL